MHYSVVKLGLIVLYLIGCWSLRTCTSLVAVFIGAGHCTISVGRDVPQGIFNERKQRFWDYSHFGLVRFLSWGLLFDLLILTSLRLQVSNTVGKDEMDYNSLGQQQQLPLYWCSRLQNRWKTAIFDRICVSCSCCSIWAFQETPI
jgi:hypothetical protein